MSTDKIYAEQLANEYAPKDTTKVVDLRKLDTKKLDKTFDLSNFYICKFDVTTSDAILTFSIFEYIL